MCWQRPLLWQLPIGSCHMPLCVDNDPCCDNCPLGAVASFNVLTTTNVVTTAHRELSQALMCWQRALLWQLPIGSCSLPHRFVPSFPFPFSVSFLLPLPALPPSLLLLFPALFPRPCWRKALLEECADSCKSFPQDSSRQYPPPLVAASVRSLLPFLQQCISQHVHCWLLSHTGMQTIVSAATGPETSCCHLNDVLWCLSTMCQRYWLDGHACNSWLMAATSAPLWMGASPRIQPATILLIESGTRHVCNRYARWWPSCWAICVV